MNKRNKKKLMELQELYEKYAVYKEFYKKHDNDKVWWVHNIGIIGRLDVSFDKKKILNLWKDYPENFTKAEKELFDKENPYWANFFRDRCLEKKTEGLKYKFLKYTYVSELEEGYLDELQEKYDFVYPDILREYYENYNESVIETCEFVANGKEIMIYNILSVKYGNESVEECIRNQKNKLIPKYYIPFARDVEGRFFYLSKKDSGIYTDINKEYCFGIKHPMKISDSVEELFDVMERNIKTYEF